MDKYKKYYGIVAFCFAVFILFFGAYKLIFPKVEQLKNINSVVESKNSELSNKQAKLKIVQNKIKRIKESIVTSQKKVYSPIEADLGNETLFFTLYNDLIEILQANSVKIKAISYVCNPESDAFVQFGKDVYLVYDVNMELVANYVNLGKFIQDIYQYPYYIRINEIDINPYQKDKRILIANVSLRLYAHTMPDENTEEAGDSKINEMGNSSLQ